MGRAFIFAGIVVLAATALAMAPKARASDLPQIVPPVIPPRRPEIDAEDMLAAIRQVETGNRPERIGAKGERSAYQFMPAVWRFHTKVPFEVATTNPGIAHTIALRHLAQLRKELAALRIPFTPEFIAAAWHHGSPKCAAHVSDDDAQRAGVLYRNSRKAAR